MAEEQKPVVAQLDREQYWLLWRDHVCNAIFTAERQIADVQGTYAALYKDSFAFYDKFTILERSLAATRLALRNLVSDVSRIQIEKYLDVETPSGE